MVTDTVLSAWYIKILIHPFINYVLVGKLLNTSMLNTLISKTGENTYVFINYDNYLKELFLVPQGTGIWND